MSHQLETIIGYKFKNPKLLETALTHTSYANESRTPVKHNERLEFLGDSVLQIVSADYLFHAYADRPEGDLTRIRASLVSEGALFQFCLLYTSSTTGKRKSKTLSPMNTGTWMPPWVPGTKALWHALPRMPTAKSCCPKARQKHAPLKRGWRAQAMW